MPRAAKCANPLFLQWVRGMRLLLDSHHLLADNLQSIFAGFHAEKDYRVRGGPPRATGYENAIRALETCQVRYEHPAEMKGKVTGVGPTTVVRYVSFVRSMPL